MAAVPCSDDQAWCYERPSTLQVTARVNYEQGNLMGELTRLSINTTNYPVIFVVSSQGNSQKTQENDCED